MNNKEIKLGKLYIRDNLDLIIVPIERYYVEVTDNRMIPSRWMIKYFFIDNPEEILEGIEAAIAFTYRELQE